MASDAPLPLTCECGQMILPRHGEGPWESGATGERKFCSAQCVTWAQKLDRERAAREEAEKALATAVAKLSRWHDKALSGKASCLCMGMGNEECDTAEFLRELSESIARDAKLPPMLKLRPCCYCGATGKVEEYNGEWARFVRVQMGVGLREMARRLKVSAAYVSDAERGRRTFPKAWVQTYVTVRAAVMGRTGGKR